MEKDLNKAYKGAIRFYIRIEMHKNNCLSLTDEQTKKIKGTFRDYSNFIDEEIEKLRKMQTFQYIC